MMEQATFIGWDFTTVWGICEDVYYPYLQFHPADNKILVTIEGPAVPAESLPVTFNIAFHLPVTGFDSADVDFSGGSMTVTAYTVTNAGDDQNYTVEVTAASGAGTIVLVIPDGVCSAVTACGASTNQLASSMVFVWNEINDVDELQLIGNDSGYPLNGAYRLGNDIDASATASWNNGAGFTPIAPDMVSKITYYEGVAFTGTFDGQGYTISNLTINRPEEDYAGIFCYIDNAAIRNVAVENLDVSGHTYVGGLVGYARRSSITNCNTTGTVSAGYDYTGGLAGYVNYSNVTNCYNMGTVSAGHDDAGGLVGYAYNSSSITNCYSTGAISAEYEGAGGLVGVISSNSIITNSYSTCTVSGDTMSGGLVGISVQDGTITNCYSTGTVSGIEEIGGLVGDFYWDSTLTNSYSTSTVSGVNAVGGLVGNFVMDSTITNCYSAGAVSGTGNDIGGLVGVGESITSVITNSYWDMESSGQTLSDGGVGQTTAAMIRQVTFSGWDFAAEWDIYEGCTYPFLRSFPLPYYPAPAAVTVEQGSAQNDPVNTSPLVFDVVFSEPVTGFEETDLDFTGSTAPITAATINDSGDGINYTVEVDVSDEGIVVLSLPVGTIIDSCNLSSAGSSSIDNSITYDLTPPIITIRAPSPSLVAVGGSVDFVVDYTGEESSWLIENDITLDVTGDVTATVTVVSAKDGSYIVTLSDIAGIGTLGFTIAAGTAIDAAGNFAAAASTPISVTVAAEVPVNAAPLALLLLGAGVVALGIRRRNK